MFRNTVLKATHIDPSCSVRCYVVLTSRRGNCARNKLLPVV